MANRVYKIHIATVSDRDPARSRHRAWLLAHALVERGHRVTTGSPPDECDCAVFQDVADLKLLKVMKARGVRVVYDLDDIHLLEDAGTRARTLAFMNLSDVVSVSSHESLRVATRYHDHVRTVEGKLNTLSAGETDAWLDAAFGVRKEREKAKTDPFEAERRELAELDIVVLSEVGAKVVETTLASLKAAIPKIRSLTIIAPYRCPELAQQGVSLRDEFDDFFDIYAAFRETLRTRVGTHTLVLRAGVELRKAFWDELTPYLRTNCATSFAYQHDLPDGSPGIPPPATLFALLERPYIPPIVLFPNELLMEKTWETDPGPLAAWSLLISASTDSRFGMLASTAPLASIDPELESKPPVTNYYAWLATRDPHVAANVPDARNEWIGWQRILHESVVQEHAKVFASHAGGLLAAYEEALSRIVPRQGLPIVKAHARLKERHADLDAAYYRSKAKIVELQAAHERGKKKYSELQSVYELKQQKYADLEATYELKRKNYADLEATYELKRKNYADLEATYDRNKATLQELQAAYDLKTQKHVDLEAAYLRRKTKYAELEDAYKRLKAKHSAPESGPTPSAPSATRR